MLIEMAIKGLMIDQVTSTPIIVLRDKDATRVLEIWVGVFEANAIAVQIENTASPRPMTHDLLRNVIEDLQGRVERVVISDVQGRHLLRDHPPQCPRRRVAIDARPSDAIALALRAKAPIFAEEHVIDHAKQAEPAASEGETERLQKWLESLDPDDMGKYKM